MSEPLPVDHTRGDEPISLSAPISCHSPRPQRVPEQSARSNGLPGGHVLHYCSCRSLSDVAPPRNGYQPLEAVSEEGFGNPVPTTLRGVSHLLRSRKDEQQYPLAVATLAYTAERAKFASGDEREQWTKLFIESFRAVYTDIMGDPDKALGLC